MTRRKTIDYPAKAYFKGDKAKTLVTVLGETDMGNGVKAFVVRDTDSVRRTYLRDKLVVLHG